MPSDSLLICLSPSKRSKMQASSNCKVVASDIIFILNSSSFISKSNREAETDACALTVWLQNNFEYFTSKFIEFMDSPSQSSDMQACWNNNREEILRLGKEEFFAKDPIKWAQDNGEALRRLGLEIPAKSEDQFVNALDDSERREARLRRQEAEAEVYHILQGWCSSGM